MAIPKKETMQEASKTNKFRPPHFASTYLSGRVLDIGAGPDLVCLHALAFDQEHGDANKIDEYFEAGSFETVHTSHSLEHMRDPVQALHRWWSLVKPGGFLIVVVPDEYLYEQNIWPSFFSPEHYSSFRLHKETGATPVSFDIGQLCRALPHAKVVSEAVQDFGYAYDLIWPGNRTPKPPHKGLRLINSVLKRTLAFNHPIRHRFHKWLVAHGYPVDQLVGDALAQIEVIVQKTA